MSDGISNPTLVEKGVLSSILFSPEDINIVADILTPEDFANSQHSVIYDKMMDFYQAGRPIDAVLIAESLETDGKLEAAGGLPYFFELSDTTALWATGHTQEYSWVIKENSRKRQVRSLASDIHEKTQSGSGYDSDAILGYTFNALQQLATTAQREDEAALERLAGITIEEVVEKSKLDPALSFTGVPTGFVDLDAKTNGFQPGQMIIVAGRPAMGKSTVAMNMATSAALFANKSVMFYSLEMTKKEFMLKILSSVANIEHGVLKTGQGLTEEHLDKLEQAKAEMEGKNLIIRDTPQVSLLQMRSQCIMQKAKPEGLDMLVVDYIGLMETAGKASDSAQEELAKLSRGLKLLAKELAIPVIVLAQLNRDNVKRADKTPTEADLRGSGSLEQDADIILLVHRPEVYDPNDRPGLAELIVAKNRGGTNGPINLVQLLEYSKFGNLANTHIDYEPEPDSDPGDRDYPDAPGPFGDADYQPGPPRETTEVSDTAW